MPAAKTYSVTRGVSCRLSQDEKSPDFEKFIEWNEGDVLEVAKAPAHLNLDWLLEVGALEEVKNG